MLAAARIAALYDRDLIMQADAQLRRLEAQIGKLTAELQGKKHDELIAAARDIADRLPDYEQQLAEIGQQMENDPQTNESRPKLIGGLTRRVVMSRFYQRQFAGLVRGFRPTRIEGFFTYNEAVIRRLGGIYDHIDAVAELYQQLEQKLIVLNQEVQTAQGVEAQKRGVRIQRFGEGFAWLAIGSLTMNEFGRQFLETLHLDADKNDKYKQYLMAGAIIAGAIGAMHRPLWKGFKFCARSITRSTDRIEKRLWKLKTARKCRNRYRWSRRTRKNVSQMMRSHFAHSVLTP
jgi:hypothetical protein